MVFTQALIRSPFRISIIIIVLLVCAGVFLQKKIVSVGGLALSAGGLAPVSVHSLTLPKPAQTGNRCPSCYGFGEHGYSHHFQDKVVPQTPGLRLEMVAVPRRPQQIRSALTPS